jgi:tetratricopeptide (TPR) repeat protein
MEGEKMTFKNFSIRQFFGVVPVMFIVVVIASFGFFSCKGPDVDKTVIQAYELRMNGKADEAKTMLEQVISDEPENALAYYELARTKNHIGLSVLRELENALESSRESIDKAIENDPDSVIYLFFAGYIASQSAYMAAQRGQPEVKEKYSEVCSIYESVLRLKPDYHEAMLYLVQIYGVLPEEMGGDKTKAEQYAKKLEEMDEIFGIKARAILLPEEADSVGYWQKVLDKHEGNAEVLGELGRAYLYIDQVEDGIKCFEEAASINPGQNILFLDLARYHTYTGLYDEKQREAAFPLAEKAFKRYLDSEPIPPLKAFALNLLSRIKRGMGDQEGADELRERAEIIDPYYSRASGVPTPDLWVPLGEISHNTRSLFRPF